VIFDQCHCRCAARRTGEREPIQTLDPESLTAATCTLHRHSFPSHLHSQSHLAEAQLAVAALPRLHPCSGTESIGLVFGLLPRSRDLFVLALSPLSCCHISFHVTAKCLHLHLASCISYEACPAS
jgi:hypothetical protein